MILNDGLAGKRWFFLVPLVLAAVSISCTDFFSGSWASWAARDPDKLIPAVTTGNVEELKTMAENDPDLSLALLKKIETAADGTSGGDKAALRAAALATAGNAAGLGQALLNTVEDLDSIDAGNAVNMVVNALNSMKNLETAGTVLSAILPADPSSPEFTDFVTASNAEDLAIAAAVLIAAEAKTKAAPEDYNYITNFSPGTYPLAEKMAEEAYNRAGTDDSLSQSFKEILGALNLVP